MELSRRNLADLIDSTLLGAFARESDIQKLCQDAIESEFWAVCVNPVWVPYAARFAGRRFKVVAVVGFPLGANTPTSQVEAPVEAVATGADEIDFVLNLGALRAQRFEIVRNEAAQIVKGAKKEAAEQGRAVLTKAIIESYVFLHADAEPMSAGEAILEGACQILRTAGVDYVKTCTGMDTGFGKSVTSPEDVSFVKKAAGPTLRIKAAGGIRSLDQVAKLVRSGASRIGTSSANQIMKEFDQLGRKSIRISDFSTEI